jgi:hypothetical protein
MWKGRHIKSVDGTTVIMADTPENQAVYPPYRNQPYGVGFPFARVVAIFSLAAGAALDLAIIQRSAGTSMAEAGDLRKPTAAEPPAGRAGRLHRR